jgi:NAD(P)-dependent dehydrogenase (short-subunit alcohol dehydrogenase family)/acyl carrier protein
MRVPAAGSGAVFEAVLGLDGHPWLRDHRVAGYAVVPGAAVADLVRAAVVHDTPGAARVNHLVFQAPLVLPETGARRLQVVLNEPSGEAVTAAVYSQPTERRPGAAWTLHATATVTTEDASSPRTTLDLAALRARCSEAVDMGVLYTHYAELGLAYGPAFRGLRSLWRGRGESLAELALPPTAPSEGWGVPPAILDGAFLAALATAARPDELLLPFEIGGFDAPQPGVPAVWVHVRVRGEARGVEADVTLADVTGAVVADTTELRLRAADREALRRANAEAPADAFCQLSWRAAPLPEVVRRRALEAESWIVVATAGSVTAATLARSLGRCALTEPSSLPAALTKVPTLAGVVFLCEPGVDKDAASAAHRAADEAIAVVHALRGRAPSRMWWVTTGAMAVEPRDTVDVAAASLWGLGRTVMQELPELGCTLVDLEPGGETDRVLMRELSTSGSDGEDQVAWRAGRRHAARLVRVAAVATEPRALLPTQGTALITGGTGALGLHVARWLAREGVEHLLLVSRRGMDAPGAAEAVAGLESLGAHVTVAAADVADRDALRAVIEATPAQWPLCGVVHVAGTLDDGMLAEQNADRFARVFSSKVVGAWNLHELTVGHDLAFFVLFSSIAGLLGAAGQGNYAAANAFLDGLAFHRRARGLPAQSLAWGAWSEGGMAATLSAAHQARYARQGLGTLTPAEGIALLGRALVRPEAHLAVAQMDLPAVRRALGPTVPPVWRALVHVPAATLGTAREGAWAAELAGMSKERRLGAVRAAVQADVARVLSLSASTGVPADRPLQELGMDSLMSVELRNALGKRAGVTLPGTLVFDYPTPSAISQYLLEKVLLSKSEAPSPRAPPLTDAEIRRALLSIPVAELRRSDLLGKLLDLAERSDAAGSAAVAGSESLPTDKTVEELGAEELMRMFGIQDDVAERKEGGL